MYAEITKLVANLEARFMAGEPLPDVADCLPDCVNRSEKELLITFCSGGIVGPNDALPLNARMFDKRFGGLAWSLPEVWQERIRQLNILASSQRKMPQTVEHQVQRFLAFKEMQVRGGVLKARTWGGSNSRCSSLFG